MRLELHFGDTYSGLYYATVLYVSPTQINFVVPPISGAVKAVAWGDNRVVAEADLDVRRTAVPPYVRCAPAPGFLLSFAMQPVLASIGGTFAAVEFAGLAPGFIGLAQVNVRVPELRSGEHVLVLTVAGTESNAAMVPVGR